MGANDKAVSVRPKPVGIGWADTFFLKNNNFVSCNAIASVEYSSQMSRRGTSNLTKSRCHVMYHYAPNARPVLLPDAPSLAFEMRRVPSAHVQSNAL